MKNPSEIVKVNTKDLEELLLHINSESNKKIDVLNLMKSINNPTNNYFTKRYLYFFLMAASSNIIDSLHNNIRGKYNYLSSEEFYIDMAKFQKLYIYPWRELKDSSMVSFTERVDHPLNIYSDGLVQEVSTTIANFNDDLYDDYEKYFNKMLVKFKNESKRNVLFTGSTNDLKDVMEVNSIINAINYMNVHLSKNQVSKTSLEYKTSIENMKNVLDKLSELNITTPYASKSIYDKRLRYNNYYLIQLYFVAKTYLIVNCNYDEDKAEELTDKVIKELEIINDNSPIFLNLHFNCYQLFNKIFKGDMPFTWIIELALNP